MKFMIVALMLAGPFAWASHTDGPVTAANPSLSGGDCHWSYEGTDPYFEKDKFYAKYKPRIVEFGACSAANSKLCMGFAYCKSHLVEGDMMMPPSIQQAACMAVKGADGEWHCKSGMECIQPSEEPVLALINPKGGPIAEDAAEAKQ